MDTGTDPLDLEVPPAPVRDPRGGRPAGLLALAAITVVIVAAIGGAQLVPPPPVPPRISFALPTSAPTTAAPTTAAIPSSDPSLAPDPSAILEGTPPRLTREDLAAAVRDGSLDGRLVFVESVIRATRVPCEGEPGASPGCVELAIPGIGVPVRPGTLRDPWPGEPPLDAWLVTVARDGGLVYLGSLVPREDGPRTVRGIVEGFGPRGRGWSDGSLFEVDGRLVTNPESSCVADGPGVIPCPSPPPVLVYDDPLGDGSETVVLSDTMPEIDPGAVGTTGTFLLAPPDDDEQSWRVVARYEPSRAVRVLVP